MFHCSSHNKHSGTNIHSALLFLLQLARRTVKVTADQPPVPYTVRGSLLVYSCGAPVQETLF